MYSGSSLHKSSRTGFSGCAVMDAKYPSRAKQAFTLAELLVVITIIGILAAVGIPALRGLGEPNAIDAATRQMLDDLAYARQRAINDRTTVYMLFVPPGVHEQVTNLAPFRYTGYTLFARRTVGEQPGRQSPRQLIPWRNLPDKTFFSSLKLTNAPSGGILTGTNLYEEPFAAGVDFQVVITNEVHRLGMFYLAFNPNGQLVRYDSRGRTQTGHDEYVPLVKGSVFHPLDTTGRYTEPAELVEVPAGNRRYIKVNWLTGRAEVLGDLLVTQAGTIVTDRPE